MCIANDVKEWVFLSHDVCASPVCAQYYMFYMNIHTLRERYRFCHAAVHSKRAVAIYKRTVAILKQ